LAPRRLSTASTSLPSPIAFKTSSNTNGKLTFGATTPEEMRYATAEGLTGTFVVAKPDYEAFTAGLVEKPAAPQLRRALPGYPHCRNRRSKR
jgi:hypothetical protein